MLRSKVLQPGEYARFLEFNKKNNGGHVDMAYIENAIIRVFYNDPEHWVAAYAINTKGTFRYLSVLTDDLCKKLLQQYGIDKQNLVEITLLSRDERISWANKYDREYYYTRSILDALATGRRFILGGAVEPKLAGAQMEVLDHLFYEGEMNFFGHAKYGWLYYASSFEIIWNAFRRLIRVVLGGKSRPNTKPRPATPDSVPNN